MSLGLLGALTCGEVQERALSFEHWCWKSANSYSAIAGSSLAAQHSYSAVLLMLSNAELVSRLVDASTEEKDNH